MMIKSQIDLGAMVFDMDTVKTHGITFLNSKPYALKRPKCPWTKDYPVGEQGRSSLPCVCACARCRVLPSQTAGH